jgi:hypothetical protein
MAAVSFEEVYVAFIIRCPWASLLSLYLPFPYTIDTESYDEEVCLQLDLTSLISISKYSLFLLKL